MNITYFCQDRQRIRKTPEMYSLRNRHIRQLIRDIFDSLCLICTHSTDFPIVSMNSELVSIPIGRAISRWRDFNNCYTEEQNGINHNSTIIVNASNNDKSFRSLLLHIVTQQGCSKQNFRFWDRRFRDQTVSNDTGHFSQHYPQTICNTMVGNIKC